MARTAENAVIATTLVTGRFRDAAAPMVCPALPGAHGCTPRRPRSGRLPALFSRNMTRARTRREQAPDAGTVGQHEHQGRADPQPQRVEGSHPQEPSHRDGHGLADPQDDHPQKDRGQELLRPVHWHREEYEGHSGRRGEEEPQGLPGPLEFLLPRREPLLAQAPKGLPSEQGGADVGPPGHQRFTPVSSRTGVPRSHACTSSNAPP